MGVKTTVLVNVWVSLEPQRHFDHTFDTEQGLGVQLGGGDVTSFVWRVFTPDNMIKPWICIHTFKGLHLLGVVGPNIDASRVRKDLLSMINKPNAYCGLIKYPTKLYTCNVCLH